MYKLALKAVKEFINKNDNNNECYRKQIVQQKDNIHINCGLSFFLSIKYTQKV